jgi:hypothetical protein
MIEPQSLDALRNAVRHTVAEERFLLDELRAQIQPLKAITRRIHPRSATAISLVGTDGGNNRIRYDPFMIQLLRVVDSTQKEYCLEVITPNTPLDALERRHLDSSGIGLTALGRMMAYLKIRKLADLSPVFVESAEQRSPSWVQVYRELTEWAVLLDLVRSSTFATDTVIVRDGFLRSKMFKSGLFGKYTLGLEEGIVHQYQLNRRRVYIAGIAKHSKVLQTYRLAMALEGVMRNAYPCHVEVDRDIEANVYRWEEYARGGSAGESFVAGKMFLVKFGSSPHDPVWATDLLISQTDEAPLVFGFLLADSVDGFPVPFYPQCLQRAHEHAELVDFDMDVLQDQACDALRGHLGGKRWLIDELALQHSDPARSRYA